MGQSMPIVSLSWPMLTGVSVAINVSILVSLLVGSHCMNASPGMRHWGLLLCRVFGAEMPDPLDDPDQITDGPEGTLPRRVQSSIQNLGIVLVALCIATFQHRLFCCCKAQSWRPT